MLQQLAPALRMTLFLTLLTGLVYPGLVTGLCQVLFAHQANGSLITQNGQVIGSKLLGQNFAKPEYFHPRPSAAGIDGYDPTASQGSNFGPTSQKLIDRMKVSADQFRKENPTYTGPIPADAITASGSGLDPDITVANAEAQAARIAQARSAKVADIESLISSQTENRDLGFAGETRINVLELNLTLDQRFPNANCDSSPAGTSDVESPAIRYSIVLSVLFVIVHTVIPFSLAFEPGIALYEQVVYAAKKAIISGQMFPGDPFPSVRELSQALKINPNTAHKVILQLVAEGLIEVRSGRGTIVSARGPGSAVERGKLLKREMEQLVVEAKKLGLSLDEVTESLGRHWRRLDENKSGRKS